MIDTAMIFAAGRGTRMKHLTANQPKPLVKVAGKPLIDHALDLVDKTTVKKVVVNTHYRADMMNAHLKDRSVVISHESPDLLETGGGLKNALPLLGRDPVVTLNSDAILTGSNPIKQLIAAWDPAKMDALMLLIDPNRAVGHLRKGDFLVDEKQRLSRGPGFTYSGCQIIKTELVESQPEVAFSLNPVWDKMIHKGTLHGIIHDGSWCDVGHPEGVELAEKMLGAHDV